MPVFGKSPSGNRAKKEPVDLGLIKRKGRKRTITVGKPWPDEKTSLGNVQKNLNFDIVQELRERLLTCGKVRVLDWGCAEGTAITSLAGMFGSRIDAIGYSGTSYARWHGERRVKFVHETKEDLLRMLKDNSIDVIYAHEGLIYVGGEYWEKIVWKLKVGGKLVADFVSDEKLQGIKRLEKTGFVKLEIISSAFPAGTALVTRLK